MQATATASLQFALLCYLSKMSISSLAWTTAASTDESTTIGLTPSTTETDSPSPSPPMNSRSYDASRYFALEEAELDTDVNTIYWASLAGNCSLHLENERTANNESYFETVLSQISGDDEDDDGECKYFRFFRVNVLLPQGTQIRSRPAYIICTIRGNRLNIRVISLAQAKKASRKEGDQLDGSSYNYVTADPFPEESRLYKYIVLRNQLFIMLRDNRDKSFALVQYKIIYLTANKDGTFFNRLNIKVVGVYPIPHHIITERQYYFLSISRTKDASLHFYAQLDKENDNCSFLTIQLHDVIERRFNAVLENQDKCPMRSAAAAYSRWELYSHPGGPLGTTFFDEFPERMRLSIVINQYGYHRRLAYPFVVRQTRPTGSRMMHLVFLTHVVPVLVLFSVACVSVVFLHYLMLRMKVTKFLWKKIRWFLETDDNGDEPEADELRSCK